MPTGLAAAPDVLARRFAAQLLSGPPARSAVEVVGRLLAVQGQDPRGARLTIRSRSAGLTAAAVDAALTAERSLLITWLNRGTLHLIRSEDYWLLHRLTVRGQHEAACWRNLDAAGVTAGQAEKAVAVITAALASEGPRTRLQIRDRLTSAGLDGNAALHLLMLTCQRGLAVRGPMIGAQHGYVLVRDWLGHPPGAPDRDADLAELARRYLAGHGPASDRDLAKWAGLPVGEARRGLADIAAELRDRPDGLAELRHSADDDSADNERAAGDSADNERAAGDSAAGDSAASLPGPKLLGGFDPVLLGWESRADIVGPHRQIVTANGLFRPFALVAGRAAGIWSWTGGSVALELFGPLPADVSAALAAEASDVQHFLGVEGE